MVQEHELPTPWGRMGEPYQTRAELLGIGVPRDAWLRRTPDPGQPFPAYRMVFSWVDSERNLHFATAGGYAAGDEFDQVTGTVVEHKWMNLGHVATIDMSLEPGGADVVTLKNGESHDDWPALLINEHR